MKLKLSLFCLIMLGFSAPSLLCMEENNKDLPFKISSNRLVKAKNDTIPLKISREKLAKRLEQLKKEHEEESIINAELDLVNRPNTDQTMVANEFDPEFTDITVFLSPMNIDDQRKESTAKLALIANEIQSLKKLMGIDN